MQQAYKKISMLARKTNFEDNIHDVFVRLLCHSNYVPFLQRKYIGQKHKQGAGDPKNSVFLSLIRE